MALASYRAPGFDPAIYIPFVLGTFYMAASLWDYRRRILTASDIKEQRCSSSSAS